MTTSPHAPVNGRIYARATVAPSPAHRAWSVDDFLAADYETRLSLRRRYAEALRAYAALPPLPESERRRRDRADKDRPSFTDPSGRPICRTLVDHIVWELERFGT